MLFRVLGPVEVDTGHAVLAPSGLRRRALLTALLLRPGQIVPAPRLVEAVWGEDPPGHPDNALQSVVARVRRDLGPAGPLLVTGPVGYGLHLRDARIDADLFEQDCRAARAAAETDPATAVALYDRALGRWRGPAYGEFAESFARPAAVRLAELRRTAAADRADALLRAGAVDEAVAAAGDLAAADPLAERPVVVLMRALAAAGRTADALAAYRHHVAHLRDELGLDPPAGLRALHERILRAEPVTPAPAARPRTPVTSPPRLTPLTGFVGRDEERAGLARDLDTHRLVTVVGVGGVGKTTLARAVAADHPTAVVCELAEVTRPDEVAGAVGDALGFPSLEAALMGLGADPRLLLLDNCEHVLDPAASAVGALLDTCPGLTVLATSREPLGLPGEQVVPLSPLPLPEGDDPARLLDSPSAALLLTRAREAGSAIVLDDPDTATAVAELCRRLDGLPLALELAAARTRSMTPAEILAHLDRRLDLLRRTRERGPQRHRSLETAIAWSYDRLPASTQRFFARLGVFSGRFTAEEAYAVAGEPTDDLLRTVDHLDHLVGQSMVTVRSDGGRSWYGLLDTLRAYARARLAEAGELDAVQDRRVDRLAELAGRTQWGAVLPGGQDAWPLARAAQTDLLNAIRWCLQRDERPDRAERLARQLVIVVHNARPEPVVELGEALLRRWPDPAARAWPEFAAITAFAYMVVRVTDRAAELAGAALAADPSPFASVLALRTLYFHDLLAGRPEQALRWADQAIGHADGGDEPGWASELRTFRASALAALGKVGEAARQADDAHARAVAVGGGFPEALAALARANLLATGDHERGREALTELAERARAAGYVLVEAPCYWSLAGIALREGRPAEAARLLGPALELLVRIGHAVPLRVTLRWIAVTAAACGRTGASAALHAAAGSARTLTLYEWAWRDLRAGEPVPGAPAPASLRDAVALARRELAVIAGTPGAGVVEPAPEPNRFVLEGAVWTVSFGGRTVRLPDAKGLRDLAVLLGRPGREVHCTELAGAGVVQPDTGELLDAQARRRYQARIVELQGELAEAENGGDRGRGDAARIELDLLIDQLAAASGLGGRSRRAGGTAERARSTVTWRIRAALRRIEELHPGLGRHLRASVRTGTWCVYAPDEETVWEPAAPARAARDRPARSRVRG